MAKTVLVKQQVLQRLVYILLPTFVSATIPMCEDHCTCDPPMITCQGAIPKQLPPNVTMVKINNYLDLQDQEHMNITDFTHLSYSGVLSLEINPHYGASSTENQHIFNSLDDDTFVGLSNLKYLQYASLNLKRLSTYTFRGLETLKSLDLSNNVNLPGSEVAKALSNETVLPDLEVLMLSNIQTSFKLGDFDSRTAIMKLRPIRTLDLSGLDLEFGEEWALSAFPNLRNLNISRCTFGVTSARQAYFSLAATQITSFDISSTNFLAIIQTFMNIFKFLEHFVVLPFEFRYKELYLNDANSKGWPSHVDIATMVRDGTRTCLTLMFDQPEYRTHINLCFEQSNSTQLEVLSARQNKIRSFSRAVFQFFLPLRYVDLRQNELGYMQQNSSSEFERLFSKNVHLTELLLSDNGLTDLPTHMFKGNRKMRILDLSHNRISSISFDLSTMNVLEFLDLSFNRISIIDQESINRLSAFEAHLLSGNITTELSMIGNVFECTCVSKETVSWFLKTKIVKPQSEMRCIFSGRQEAFTSQLLENVEYLCVKDIIIVFVSVSSVIAVSGLVVVSIYLYKRLSAKRRMEHKKELINLYQTSDRPKKYAVFLSYSSRDVDFVMTHIYKQLNAKLQEILDTDEDCVATGDTHFTPGFQLANQIIKCVEESSVVILFMTKNFCKSPWCKDEAMTAHYDRKPIILMFGEHVDSGDMPKPLQRHLQVYSRVFWKNEGGEWKLKPDWTILCEAIISFVNTKKLSISI